MSTYNGMPVVFDDEQDKGLLGSLFPMGANPLGFTGGLPNQNYYKSPFAELLRPNDGTLIKTDDPITVFENNFSYTIDVKMYDNGYEIINAYNKTTVKERDIIFFCEKNNPNKSNLFGTFVLVKYGSKYKDLLNDLISGKTVPIASHRKNSTVSKIIKTFNDEVTDNFSILTKIFSVDIEESKVKSIMSNELYANSSSTKTIKDIYEWYNNTISTVVNGITGWLEGIKFTEKDYIPQNKPMLSEAIKNALDAAKKGTDYLMPDAIENFISNSFETALSQIKNFIKGSLPQPWVLFLKKIYGTIQGMLSIFKEGVTKMADFAGEAFLLFKALLMGVANGLLSTVQTLLSAIGWLLEKNSYKIITGEFQKELQGKLEFIEDFFDLISEKAADFFSGIRSLINDFSLDKIKDILGIFGDKTKGLTKYDYAYFTGSFVFEVILGVILAYFTGGATAVAEAANLAEKVTAMLRLVAREVISTATMGAIDILQLFKVLITKFVQACKNGWKGFKQFLENLLKNKTDDIVQEEGKVLDEAFDGVSLINRGKYLGQVLEEIDIQKIKAFLTTHNVDLQIGKGDGIIEVTEYFYPSGNIVKLHPHQAAMFITNGETMKLVLREKATLYEAFHELMHFRDCQKIGKKAFLKKPLVEREKYVYDKMVRYSEYLNKKELKHAEDYINFHYYEARLTDNIGNPLKEVLPLNLDSFPKKRQEINIDKILKLK
ncbi:zincin-like metallopeptidase toxin domain-containing protein [Flavobacterium humi]|uniref:Tox-MPTase4 domain-containing protein n=1 Tax=Flavobacterium humi TaxID=2562683 RepID=A0A4Z0LAS8_9FLAO|nr:zincin-like metallopeptidase toxin domain-containing protein [Flavobacterium humi]TGD58596.1 hypothetical protein E4635_06695 [Flavobacterium humi]